MYNSVTIQINSAQSEWYNVHLIDWLIYWLNTFIAHISILLNAYGTWLML
jgi:hypothetical protein